MKYLGVDLLRINMSHTPIETMKKTVDAIRSAVDIPICVDTEGAQIRTGYIKNGGIEVSKDSLVQLTAKKITGDSGCFSLTPPEALEYLVSGTLVYVDYNRVLLFVVGNTKGKTAVARVICGGVVGSNKAVNIDKSINLPSITERDYQAIEFAKQEGINVFALSFARDEEAVRQLRAVVGGGAVIISKVETRESIINLEGVICLSDAILIDRGDLSREIPIEQIPGFQKMIISRAHKRPIPVYVATNLLESMVSVPHPTRAEVSDIANTLLDGANGLVLAAETAIGKYPVQCIGMVKRLIQQHQAELEQRIFFDQSWPGMHLIEGVIPPHGFNRKRQSEPVKRKFPRKTTPPKMTLGSLAVRDVFNLGFGCYAPLGGFMGRGGIESVLNNYTLSDGTIWPMPIVLQVESKAIPAGLGDRVALVSGQNGESIGWLDISDIYKFDFESVALRWFGTTNAEHPGVCRLARGGDYFIGGEVSLVQLKPSDFSEYFLSPAQVRAVFAHYGWNRVVGFHTRNIPHCAHEYIQKKALEKTSADALFIHPVLGQKKSGDFTPEVIMAGYKALIENYYPVNKVFLSGFFTDSWYAGPREAVFTALCRKNYGCSHFIVGRDHTGVGKLYKTKDVRALFENLGDLGIEPIFFDRVVYDKKQQCCCETSLNTASKHTLEISGTQVRNYILADKAPPQWMVRPEVSEAVLKIKTAKKEVIVP